PDGLTARRRRSVGSDAFCAALVPEIGFDRALELDGHRVAEAIAGLAGRDADPALAHAIFLDVGLLLALEADSDAAPQGLGVEEGALRVDREAIGRRVGHHGPHAEKDMS